MFCPAGPVIIHPPDSKLHWGCHILAEANELSMTHFTSRITAFEILCQTGNCSRLSTLLGWVLYFSPLQILHECKPKIWHTSSVTVWVPEQIVTLRSEIKYSKLKALLTRSYPEAHKWQVRTCSGRHWSLYLSQFCFLKCLLPFLPYLISQNIWTLFCSLIAFSG